MPEGGIDIGGEFGKYANFHNSETKPDLPIADYHTIKKETKYEVVNKAIRVFRGWMGWGDRVEKRIIGFNDEDRSYMGGGFSMGVPFETVSGDKVFAKITMAGDVHRESVESDMVVLEDIVARHDPLVRKGRVESGIENVGEDKMGEILEADRSEVIKKLQELAMEKRETQDTLQKYIGEFMPKYYGTVITDSPRQEIQKRSGPPSTRLTEEQLKEVPNAETTLMEIWEDVDSRGAADKIRKGMKDENSRLEMQRFANGTLELIVNEGIMIDICDMGGVECLGENEERSKRVRGLDNLAELDESTTFVPRNTVFKEGKVKFFDTYPVYNSRLGTKEISELVLVVAQDNWLGGSEKYLSSVPEDQKKWVEFVITYLYLLKKMGADMFKD